MKMIGMIRGAGHVALVPAVIPIPADSGRNQWSIVPIVHGKKLI